MKVKVDGRRCQGHARCVVYAPETFVFDDEGFASVRDGYEEVKPEFEEGVVEAVANCPENAIVVSDDEARH